MKNILYLLQTVFAVVISTYLGNKYGYSAQKSILFALIMWIPFLLGALSEIFRKKEQ